MNSIVISNLFPGATRLFKLNSLKLYSNVSPPWWARKEEIIDVIPSSTNSTAISNNQIKKSLFDVLYDIDSSTVTSNNQNNNGNEISSLTLRDISDAYYFSLSYLGDFVIQIGASSPIDPDAKLGDFLTGEQVYAVMEAINTLDPLECNLDFDSVVARELVDDLQISQKKFVRICDDEGFNLPFGMDTVLHKSVVERIMEVHEYDEYAGEDISDVVDVE